jgi:hypothetical protein
MRQKSANVFVSNLSDHLGKAIELAGNSNYLWNEQGQRLSTGNKGTGNKGTQLIVLVW